MRICGLGIKMDPIILVALIANHTPNLTSRNGTAWMNMWFSADQYVLFWEFVHLLMWNRATSQENECGVLRHAPREATSLQNSALFRDLCRRSVCGPQLYFMEPNATVLLHFVLMSQTCPLTAQVKPAIFYFWKCLIWHQFCIVLPQLVRIFCLFSCCLELNPMLRTFSRIGKLSSLKLKHHPNFV
jgi:hypothetical protein